jgi:antitoxin (DNA-binding transcriptional repressor) of toxin-antitoxin stability system
MCETITIEEAQARLAELIGKLNPGEEVMITEDDQPVAKLTRQPGGQWPCQPGSAKNTPHWMAPDFDAPLDDFKEYFKFHHRTGMTPL